MPRFLHNPAIFAVFLLVLRETSAQQLQHRPAERDSRVVACRVMEAHVSVNPAVSVVVFHQRDKADAERFSTLLRNARDGGQVEFQRDEGGAWRPASVARLRSCFGRGLLILPTAETPLTETSTFLLRFPTGS